MHKELKIVKVVFEFEDGSEKIVEDEELGQWRAILLQNSDYFLPGTPDMILGVMRGFTGFVAGYIPPDALEMPRAAHGGKWVRYEDWIGEDIEHKRGLIEKAMNKIEEKPSKYEDWVTEEINHLLFNWNEEDLRKFFELEE